MHFGPYLTERPFLIRPGFEPGLFDPDGSGHDSGRFGPKRTRPKAVKGQVIADFITHHREGEVTLLELTPWALFFDGSTCKQGGGVGIVLISPQGISFEYAIPIKPTSTNNQV